MYIKKLKTINQYFYIHSLLYSTYTRITIYDNQKYELNNKMFDSTKKKVIRLNA